MSSSKEIITIETMVNAPVHRVWSIWTDTHHITQWNAASTDWHTPKAQHDLREGGTFKYRMEAKDGSFGFDLTGTFDEVVENEYLEYTMGDERKVKLTFSGLGPTTHIEEEFEAESENSIELQRAGWQAILDNFKRYVEGQDEEE